MLTLATYLGIADCDSIAVWQKDIFLACHSPDIRLPVEVKGAKPVPNIMSGYVLRINRETLKLVYAVRIGGGDFTAAFRIKVDRDGFANVAGLTRARDFPVTADALQTRFGGGESDAFFAKVSLRGEIVYATFLGGSGTDQGNGLELDGNGGVFVGGTTSSSDFPGQRNPRSGGHANAFVSCFRPADRFSLRTAVFGGSDEEKLTGLAADGRSGVFAVGYTRSIDYPRVAAVQNELRGPSDLFLTRLRIPDLAITFSTPFGGSADDSGWGVTVDGAGNPVVAGITNSNDLPVSKDAFQRTAGGGLDAFVARFEGPGYRRVRLTYFGGAKDDSSGYDGDDIKLDPAGNVWLAGLASSPDIPGRRAAQHASAAGDADGFLAVFSPDLTRLCYSTYHGGSERDLLEGIDIASDGSVFSTGVTFSNDLKLSARAIQRTPSGINVAGKIASTMLISLSSTDPCH